MFKFLVYAFAVFGLLIFSVLGLIATGVGWFFYTTPRPLNLHECLTTSLYHVRLCPNDPVTYTRLEQISPFLRAAVIASEDTTFYSHNGFDFFELQRSFETNLQEGRFARGGSTLTQQLAKNVYLNSEKSLLRKAREVLVTYQIEQNFTKAQILEKYLNVVEFGKDLYGVTSAAKTYFGKTPAQLSMVESAFLAFLLPNPVKYSSSFHKRQLTKFARKQVGEILLRMKSLKSVSEEDYLFARAELDRMWTGAKEDLSATSDSAPLSDADASASGDSAASGNRAGQE